MFNSQSQQKTAHQKFNEAWIEMHSKEWLFPQNFEIKDKGRVINGPMSSEDYVSEFVRRGNLFVMRVLQPYRFPIMEKYKEKVALSAHLTHPSGSAVPYTIFQLDNAKTHLILDWVWNPDEEEFMFLGTLFLSNQNNYAKFLKENRAHEFDLKDPTMGFAAGANSH